MGQTRSFGFFGLGGNNSPPQDSGDDNVAVGSAVASSGDAGAQVAPPSISDMVNERLVALDSAWAEATVSAASSASALEGAGIGPVVLMMRAIEGLHIYAGLPWWGAIVGMTVAVRVVLMPLYFNGLKAGAMMRKLTPQTQKLQARMKWAQSVGDTHTHKATAQELQQLFKKNGVNPIKPLLGGLAQIPVFISLIWAVRRIGENAADFEGWTNGGMLWWSDLTASDPRLSLPLMTCAFNLMATQLNKNIHDTPMMSASTMKNVFRGMSIVFVPVTMGLPAAMHVSFATTGFTMMMQMAATNSVLVRRLVGLPEEWPVKVPVDPNAPKREPVQLFGGVKSQAPPPPPPPLPTNLSSSKPAAPAAPEAANGPAVDTTPKDVNQPPTPPAQPTGKSATGAKPQGQGNKKRKGNNKKRKGNKKRR